MRKIKITEVTSILRKNQEMKKFLKEVFVRLKACPFSYNTTQIKYEISGINIKVEDSYQGEVLNKKLNLNYTDIIYAPCYELTESALVKIIAKHLVDALPSVIDYNKVEISVFRCFIVELVAWGDKKVGLYFIEQECGEHWITLPKEADTTGKSGCYVNLQN